jgi:hypothetical protein
MSLSGILNLGTNLKGNILMVSTLPSKVCLVYALLESWKVLITILLLFTSEGSYVVSSK